MAPASPPRTGRRSNDAPPGLAGRLRFVGDDHVIDVRDVRAAGPRLTFALPMRQTYPVALAFTGLDATGTWGDPAAGGGAATATKRR